MRNCWKNFRGNIKIKKILQRASCPPHKMDSIVLLSSKPITFRNKKGIIYFFKYRVKKDDEWKIGISGLQPENINETGSNSQLSRLTDKRIREDEPLDDQLQLQLKKILFSLSKSGRNFYQGQGYRFRREDF